MTLTDIFGLAYIAPPPPPLHQQLRDAGLALAGMINAGDLGALRDDTRYELTTLSLALDRWAAQAEAQHEATRARTPRELIRQPTICLSCGGEVA